MDKKLKDIFKKILKSNDNVNIIVENLAIQTKSYFTVKIMNSNNTYLNSIRGSDHGHSFSSNSDPWKKSFGWKGRLGYEDTEEFDVDFWDDPDIGIDKRFGKFEVEGMYKEKIIDAHNMIVLISKLLLNSKINSNEIAEIIK